MAKAPRPRANETTAPASGEPRPRSRPRRKSDAPPARETATLSTQPEGFTDPQPERVLAEDEIRLRAYQRYLERGGTHGMDLDDWVEAERELKSKI